MHSAINADVVARVKDRSAILPFQEKPDDRSKRKRDSAPRETNQNVE
jgi:hypothetical protein